MDDYSFLYICGMVDEEDPGFSRMKSIDISADNLSKLFYQGFVKNLGRAVDIVKDRYGLLYPDLPGFLKKQTEKGELGAERITASYINYNKLLKMISKSFSMVYEVLKWASGNRNSEMRIVVYSLHFPYILAAAAALIFSGSVRVYCIVPDLPLHMDPELKSRKVKYLLKKLENRIYNRLLLKFSAFIVLSEETANWLSRFNKKVFVIPGMVSSEEAEAAISENLDISRERYILYTGSLEERYGLGDLVNAFTLASIEDCELVICGDGTYREEISRAAEKHSNIRYLGSVPRSRALELQKKASILVNPRSSAGDYTRYSFPSKTMEYLLSGTPVLMRPLPGIIPEFENFVFLDREQTVESLAEKMSEIFSVSHDVKSEIAKKSLKYISETKTETAQTSEFCKYLLLNH